MRVVISIITGSALAGVLLAGPALADSKMQQCAAQWQQLKTANKTGGQTYQQWSAKCLKS